MTKELQTKVYSIDKPAEMSKMAVVLRSYIVKNKLSVDIVGKDYVMVEGWQFAGGLMGLFPRIVKVENTGPGKWLAQAEIIDKRTDKVVGTGFAVCSKDEQKKKSFDDYAILSMAQTRAIGKAYRNLIGWVIKMTGCESTPAEEIKPELVKEIKAKVAKSNATTYLEQLKAEVFGAGAKDEKTAVKIINERTGLKLTDFKITEKHAKSVLFQFLNSK